jgi:hypothetical protein
MLSIGETGVWVFQDLVQEPLKGSSGFSQAEGHKGKLKNAKRGRGGNHSFLNIFRVYRKFGDMLSSGPFWRRWCNQKGGGQTPLCV